MRPVLLLVSLLLLLAPPARASDAALHRCCPAGQWLSESGARCRPAPADAAAAEDFPPALHRRGDNGSLLPAGGAPLPLLERHPCPRAYFPAEPELDAGDAHVLLASGDLLFPGDGSVVAAGQFCVAPQLPRGRARTLLCDELAGPPPLAPARAALGGLTLLSALFLLATFAVYASVRRLRNHSGLCLMSHTAALFVAYVTIGVAQIFPIDSNDTCFVAAFIIYFSFLASFFWLNVMCFDIFWTFSGFRSLRGTAREREHKKFIIYSIYSWGCPLIMLCVTLVMQFHDNIPEGYLRPQFGVKKCWFTEDKLTTLAYFYGPVGVLVLCNIILFILTACKIAKLKRETAMLKGTDSRRHDDDNRQRFNLYLKLFLVMGVNWSMEVISWLVGGPEYVWYVTDICNTLQGVLIFVIFVWKDRIRRMLMEKFCPKRASTKLSKSTAVTYSTRASPSRLSHGMLNNKIVDNGNGEAVKIVAISPISDDSDVP